MDSREQPAEVGTHSAALGTPFIQMGQLLHPTEIEQRSRAVDMTTALSVLQSEVALLRAEVTVLKVAVVTELEHVFQLRAQLDREIGFATTDIQRLNEDIKRRAEILELAISRRHSDVIRAIDEMLHEVRIVREEVRNVPETYWWPRFKRWLNNVF